MTTRPQLATDEGPVSNRAAKRERQAERVSRQRLGRTMPDVARHLANQVAFLRASATSYDSGFEAEAQRLAIVLRVLLYDTSRQVSLLSHLGLKDRLGFENTADPIVPGNLLPTLGLVLMRITVVPKSGHGRYVAPLADVPPQRKGRRLPFSVWWTRAVTRLVDGRTLTREDYVCTVANTEGGAHVDPALDPMYSALAHENAFGFVYQDDSGEAKPFEGDAALASVRQIAHEVDVTLSREVPDLLRVASSVEPDGPM